MPTGQRPSVTPADTYPAFDTNEAFKSAAKRFGVSPNTLRKWWVEKFGQEAFDARGKKLHSEAGVRSGAASVGKPRNLTEVSEPCSSCGQSVTLSLIQKSRLTRVLCVSCDELERGVDRHCPVCGLGCAGERGLSGHMARPQVGDPEAHAAYLRGREDAVWAGKTEGVDFIRCLICGHRGVRIDRHLSSEHHLSVDAYRKAHPDACVQAQVLIATRSEFLREHRPTAPGTKKTIACHSCGEPYEVAWSIGIARTDKRRPDLRCPDCQYKARWGDKVEPQDYVTCAVCGHRAESLVSHIRNVHPELEGSYQDTFPGSLVTALGSNIRDKTHLKGKPLPDETRTLMSQNAGRWNKGLTKETDSRMAQAAQNMIGRAAWSEGRTKATEPRLQATAAGVSKTRAVQHWTNGTEVILTPDQLLPFACKNGKISVGRAIAALGHAFVTIRRECEKHGLPISHTAVSQAICLETLSQVLGGVSYETEWNDGTFINPKTGGRFRFDGFFPTQKLLVEFHGSQHYNPDSVWFFEGGETYEDLIERDQEKARQAEGRFKLLVVREDEPYTDPTYLRGRLIDEGFLDP